MQHDENHEDNALTRAINERRQDTEFMERLRRNIELHKPILDRLAEDD